MMEWLVLLDWRGPGAWSLAAFFGVWAMTVMVGGLFGHVLMALVVGLALGAVASVSVLAAAARMGGLGRG